MGVIKVADQFKAKNNNNNNRIKQTIVSLYILQVADQVHGSSIVVVVLIQSRK